MEVVRRGWRIAKNPDHTAWIAPLLWFADAALCLLIVLKVPYTEIDWKAYMQQVGQYISGERNYVKIHGDTGPLVYPAAHLYIYRILYSLTNGGEDIRLAQYIFIGVYLATLGLVMQCYRQAGAPPYVLTVLILSKRLHSIFLLRLFNDGFAVFFLFLAIFCYQRRLWTIGSFAYSFGLAVKMSLLLALPAIGIILWQAMGRNRALRQAMMMAQLQTLLAYPFIAVNPRSYLSRAFEFTRQFLFKWTVNWRFIGEDMFQSKGFAIALLIAHASLLALFASTRWLHVPVQHAFKKLIDPPSEVGEATISRRVTPKFILTSILSAVIIGCLCARSLHYQFYAYVAWSTPFLLWRSGVPPGLLYASWYAQEYAWNVYPSTKTSSVMVIWFLSFPLIALLLDTPEEKIRDDTATEKQPDG